MSDNSEGKGGSSGDELEALLAAEFEDQLESAPAADQDSELEPAKRRKLGTPSTTRSHLFKQRIH